MTALEHPAQTVPPGRILRYGFRERITHWVAALSYVYLLLTGLAFHSPWLFWLAIALGGGQISRMLHPWIGLLFIAAVLQMYGLWASQMGITDDDRAWFRSVNHYIRNEDEKMPPVGRYNAGQKLRVPGKGGKGRSRPGGAPGKSSALGVRSASVM